MAQGCQGQGDGGVGGAEEQDDGVPAGGHFGGARGQGDGSTSGWRGRGLGVMRESLAVTSMLVATDHAQHDSLHARTSAVRQSRVQYGGDRRLEKKQYGGDRRLEISSQ